MMKDRFTAMDHKIEIISQAKYSRNMGRDLMNGQMHQAKK